MRLRDTVDGVFKEMGVPLSPQYQEYANRVITALEHREAEIVSNLTMYATDQGLSEDTTKRALEDCGLEVSQPPTLSAVPDPRIAAAEAMIAEAQATLREIRG